MLAVQSLSTDSSIIHDKKIKWYNAFSNIYAVKVLSTKAEHQCLPLVECIMNIYTLNVRSFDCYLKGFSLKKCSGCHCICLLFRQTLKQGQQVTWNITSSAVMLRFMMQRIFFVFMESSIAHVLHS